MTAEATKTSLKIKSVFMLLQSLLGLLHFIRFDKYWRTFRELNSKGQYQSSEKEKEGHLVFKIFHTIVVRQRQINVQKRVMYVQSCCFANQAYCFFDILVAVGIVVA